MSDDAAATAKKRRRESDAIEQSRKKRAKRQKTRSTIQEEAASLVKSADTQCASLLTSNPGAVDPLKIASVRVSVMSALEPGRSKIEQIEANRSLSCPDSNCPRHGVPALHVSPAASPLCALPVCSHTV